jgi:hypothetical protein
MLRQLITDDDGNDDGGGRNSDARRTNRMKAHSSHSTDTVGNSGTGSIDTGNIHIRNSLPDLRTQFRPKRQRQNAARERKPVPLPPMQLREVFSNSLFLPPNH